MGLFSRKESKPKKLKTTSTPPPKVLPSKANGKGPYREEPPEAQIAKLKNRIRELETKTKGEARLNREKKGRIEELNAALKEEQGKSRKFRKWWKDEERRLKDMTDKRESDKVVLNERIVALEAKLKNWEGEGDASKVRQAKARIDTEAERAIWDEYVAGALAGLGPNHGPHVALMRAATAFLERPHVYEAPTDYVDPLRLPESRQGPPGALCERCFEHILATEGETHTCPCGATYHFNDPNWVLDDFISSTNSG